MFHSCVVMEALLLLALPLLVSMETCPSAGTPGLHGVPGLPGKDGRNGEKGVKGVAGVVLGLGQKPEKGEQGEQGKQGPAGKRGRSGERGRGGLPGPVGPPGKRGESVLLQSAFSVARGTATAPTKASPILFTSVITNINEDYDTQTGRFRCRIPGTYYFVYHASSDNRLCLLLKLDGTILASFCDLLYDNQRQVNSGGLAVYLKMDQEVWLETGEHNGMTGKPEGNSVFSGFLLYSH